MKKESLTERELRLILEDLFFWRRALRCKALCSRREDPLRQPIARCSQRTTMNRDTKYRE